MNYRLCPHHVQHNVASVPWRFMVVLLQFSERDIRDILARPNRRPQSEEVKDFEVAPLHAHVATSAQQRSSCGVLSLTLRHRNVGRPRSLGI